MPKTKRKVKISETVTALLAGMDVKNPKSTHKAIHSLFHIFSTIVLSELSKAQKKFVKTCERPEYNKLWLLLLCCQHDIAFKASMFPILAHYLSEFDKFSSAEALGEESPDEVNTYLGSKYDLSIFKVFFGCYCLGASAVLLLDLGEMDPIDDAQRCKKTVEQLNGYLAVGREVKSEPCIRLFDVLVHNKRPDQAIPSVGCRGSLL